MFPWISMPFPLFSLQTSPWHLAVQWTHQHLHGQAWGSAAHLLHLPERAPIGMSSGLLCHLHPAGKREEGISLGRLLLFGHQGWSQPSLANALLETTDGEGGEWTWDLDSSWMTVMESSYYRGQAAVSLREQTWFSFSYFPPHCIPFKVADW